FWRRWRLRRRRRLGWRRRRILRRRLIGELVMKGMLIQDDVKLVEDKLKQFERNTGCELLLVVANTADPYPAAPWRFGFIAALLISLVFTYFFEFQHALLWPVSFFLLL